ncbi:MAG TPA: 50S ribosomal protein L5 [Candidatus Saccharimonadales bacterium]|nr:50S ribosomal protein L5 [Candidatus Saccharimonadales bacterium]
MATKKATTTYVPRLKALYKEQIAADLQKKLELRNINQVPRLEKIVINVGIGKHKDDKRYHEIVVNTLRKITGQQPIDRMAKKSVATFKIRAGMNRIGVSVTLRDQRMYEFMDRLVNVVLPRVRDFHGVSKKAFDKSGNYSLGLSEQSVFPELTFEETTVPHGLQITFVVRGEEPAHSRALLEAFGMPFEKEETR